MKILLTGRQGQLGYELERSLQSLGDVIALDRQQCDLADLDQVRQQIRLHAPQLLVNSAAYTAVDLAESAHDQAMRANAQAPALMAEEMARLGGAMVHYSTDYVFDGTQATPYRETDVPAPLNVYGRSKLLGERAVTESGVPHLIFRTSWLYAMRGRNFLLTMRKLAAERSELRIVDDQIGAPTWVRTVADASTFSLSQMVRAAKGFSSEFAIDADIWAEHGGLYHLTCSGQTSWFGFAQALLQSAPRVPSLIPIPSSDYPTPARRPHNSVLSCERFTRSFCRLPDWRIALALSQN